MLLGRVQSGRVLQRVERIVLERRRMLRPDDLSERQMHRVHGSRNRLRQLDHRRAVLHRLVLRRKMLPSSGRHLRSRRSLLRSVCPRHVRDERPVLHSDERKLRDCERLLPGLRLPHNVL